MKVFLEYYKGNPIMNPNSGLTNKDPNRANSRKNINTVNKPVKSAHPMVDKVVNGSSNNVKISGQELKKVADIYGIDLSPGKKGLGNSKAMIEIGTGPDGQLTGIITRR